MDLILSKNQIKEKIDFSEERFRSVLQLFEKHKKIIEEKNSEFLEVNSKISVINSRKEVPLKLRDKIMSLENCPTCFQNVHEEHKDKISKRTTFDIEELDRDFEQRINEKNSLIKEIEKEKELIAGYEFDKNKLQQDKIKFEHQKSIEIKIKSDIFILERTSNEVIELQKNLENLLEKNKTFEKSSEIFKKNKEDYENVNLLLRGKEITLATKEKELELIKLRLEELREDIEKKECIGKQTIYLKGLHDWIKGEFISLIDLTEKNVMVKLRNEFSSIFMEWFSMLVSDSLSVRLDEDFTPIITNKDYEIEYDFLSGGERTAVALAYRLSLNQVLNSMLSQIKTKDLVILDEPTDGFATEQIDKMRDIFDQLKAEQIILVSHEQKIEGFVDHVKRIRKDEVSLVGD
jgi:exonuclease SbcC